MPQPRYLPCLPRRSPDQHRAYDTGVCRENYGHIREIVKAGVSRIIKGTRQKLGDFIYNGSSEPFCEELKLSTGPGPGVYKAESFTPPLGREEVFSSPGIDIDCVPQPYESPLSTIDIVLEKFREQGSEALSSFDQESLKWFSNKDPSCLPQLMASVTDGCNLVRMRLIEFAIRDLARERQEECAGKLANGIIECISYQARNIATFMTVLPMHGSAHYISFSRSDMAKMGIGAEFLQGGTYLFDTVVCPGDLIRRCWMERVCKLAVASVNEKLKAGLIKVEGARVSHNPDPSVAPEVTCNLEDGDIKFELDVNCLVESESEIVTFGLKWEVAEKNVEDGKSHANTIWVTNISIRGV